MGASERGAQPHGEGESLQAHAAIITGMPPRILSLGVLVTSLLVAACAWVLVWWLLPLAQGLATAMAGGQFIGVSVPTWAQPWALVNEPSVGFAATRTALWAYWLPPFALAVLGALLLPQFPAGVSLARHLFLNHLALAFALLGLGWLPGLGLDDGLLSGLSRFFGLEARLWLWVAALAAGLLTRPAVLAFTAYLWHTPGGPTPGRKAAVWAAHSGGPAASWLGFVAATAPRFPREALAPFLLALVLSLLWAVGTKPPHPLRTREIGAKAAWLALALALVVVAPSLVAFSPLALRPRGYLWGVERLTSNVRPEIRKLKLPLSPAAQPGSSAPRS